jgi:type II secretory pathway predicted ATPase ExeA
LIALRNGVHEQKGLALLIGEVGTGKTTLIRHFLDSCGPDIKTAFIFHTAQSFEELLQMILQDLEVPCRDWQRLEMLEALNAYLLQEAVDGQRVVLIIDEAQRLSMEVLEELRMLSNLETSRHKLLQVILVGQLELAAKLRHPNLRQLQQRIAVAAELKPLTAPEVEQYIVHRLKTAGYSGQRLLTRRALRQLYRASGGIPRLINVICDRSLNIGHEKDARQINGWMIQQALRERSIFSESMAPSRAAGGSQVALRHHRSGQVPRRKAALMLGLLIVLILLFLPTAKGGSTLATHLSRTLARAELLGKTLWRNVSGALPDLETTTPAGQRVPPMLRQESAPTDVPPQQ